MKKNRKNTLQPDLAEIYAMKKVEKFSMARCVLCCRRLADIYETQFRRNYYESDATTSTLDQNIDGFQGE